MFGMFGNAEAEKVVDLLRGILDSVISKEAGNQVN